MYTIILVPSSLLAAEYLYTIKCKETPPTDRPLKYSSLTTKRYSENKAYLDRFERSAPITSLKAAIPNIDPSNIDEQSLARRLAKQIWLTTWYQPQRYICERVFKPIQEVDANLTVSEIEQAKVQVGMDVSQHLVVDKIVGGYVQYTPRIPDGVDFQGPGGVVTFDVERRGDNVVFGIECASVGIPQHGRVGWADWTQIYLHKIYSRLLLEGAVRRVLHGEGE